MEFRVLAPGDSRRIHLGVDIGTHDDHAALAGVAWAIGLFDLYRVESEIADVELVQGWGMRDDGVFPVGLPRAAAIEFAGLMPDGLTVGLQVADIVDVVLAMEWEPALDWRANAPIVDPAEVKATILQLQHAGIDIARVVYDPYQFFAEGLSLVEAGLDAEEFPQTTRRIESDTALRRRIASGRLRHAGNYTDLWYNGDALTKAIVNARSKEYPPRGTRIQKGAGGSKVDLAVALSMASWSAEQSPPVSLPEGGTKVQLQTRPRDLRAVGGRRRQGRRRR